MVLIPVTSPPPRIPSSRYIFLNFVTTLKYHSSPSLFFSLYRLSISSCLSRENRILPAILTDRIRSLSLSSPLSLSLHLSTARDESRGLRVLGKSSDRESRPHFFVRVKKKRRNKTKRENVCLNILPTRKEINNCDRELYIGRFVTDILLCRATASSVWSSGKYISTQRRCRYGRRDGGALSLSILYNVSFIQFLRILSLSLSLFLVTFLFYLWIL